MSRRKKIGGGEKIVLNEECSAVVSMKVPFKLRDPDSFTIAIEIGRVSFRNALRDVGASINLMSLSIYRRLGLGELKEMTVSLQLAYQYLVCLDGVLEVVLVNVRKFIFPIDFTVLDFEEDHKILVLVRRPFLATSRAIIDVRKRELTMDIEGETKIFKCVEPKSRSNEVLQSQGCSYAMQENSKVNEDKANLMIFK
ncbi:uncharacterized protein [Gossypium hirsutum]|uniref:Uncharacterized protein n=1 Tax=Gossypium hirsutum TaxID=3635 RepID=A0A1U8P8I8_GOSHI|nr:uncharacterized protein LOC107956340 [Gossypium hirsutum]